jgi:hypothetical protein
LQKKNRRANGFSECRGRTPREHVPWGVVGRAAFTIVDPKLEYCQPGEGCPTPWDYCCKTDELPANRAMVKVVNAAGETVEEDARQLLGVKELQTVVVKGKAKRDEAGNLTVLADRVFVMCQTRKSFSKELFQWPLRSIFRSWRSNGLRAPRGLSFAVVGT